MKVAYVIGALPFGGVETLTLDTMLKFRERGDLEHVMVNISGCGVKQQDYLDAGIEVVNLADSLKSLKTQSLGTVTKLRRFFKQYQPDIIHALLFPGNYFSRLAAIGLNIPVINHIRNIVSDSNPSLRHKLINRGLSPLTSLYISVSHAVRQYTEQELNRAGKPSIVIYNGFSPDKLQNSPAHDLRAMYGFSGPVIAQVGHMVRIKNFDLTIEAFRLLLQKMPEARLLFIGDGPERDKLETMAQGLEGKLVFSGYRTDVYSFLKSCSLMVMPSEHEGFSIAFLEAMACGLPAVISEHVPSKEVSGEAALICELNPESLADNMLKALGSNHAAMSEAALKVAARHTVDKHCDSLLTVYNMLLKHEPFTRVLY